MTLGTVCDCNLGDTKHCISVCDCRGDAADLILSQLGNASMVHLLQQLYTADDATRQSIIIKVLDSRLFQLVP